MAPFKLKTKYQGFHVWRLEREPAEVKYATAWQTLNEKRLPLTDPSGHREPAFRFHHVLRDAGLDPKTQDLRVAATLIQWLGSPVGESFVKNVFQKRRKFRASWRDELKMTAGPMGLSPDTLDYLLHVGDQRFVPKCSARDRQVAGHLMAWLDTDPGRAFIKSVLD